MKPLFSFVRNGFLVGTLFLAGCSGGGRTTDGRTVYAFAERDTITLSELFGKLIHIERKGRPDDEIAFITPSYIEYDLDSKLEELSRYAIIKSKIRLL